jgi:uncharacterized protein (DUF488 family)
MGTSIYTLGHSTRPREELLSILDAFSIGLIVDIRAIPRSRRNPQYDQDEFRRWLKEHGVNYMHLGGLGGLRHPRKDSVNTAWKNDSFRGYADYMQTAEFTGAIEELIALAALHTSAIVCAEAVPWRCHRSLVADALLVRGIDVRDILSATVSKPHKLTPWAAVDGIHVTYPQPGGNTDSALSS